MNDIESYIKFYDLFNDSELSDDYKIESSDDIIVLLKITFYYETINKEIFYKLFAKLYCLIPNIMIEIIPFIINYYNDISLENKWNNLFKITEHICYIKNHNNSELFRQKVINYFSDVLINDYYEVINDPISFRPSNACKYAPSENKYFWNILGKDIAKNIWYTINDNIIYEKVTNNNIYKHYRKIISLLRSKYNSFPNTSNIDDIIYPYSSILYNLQENSEFFLQVEREMNEFICFITNDNNDSDIKYTIPVITNFKNWNNDDNNFIKLIVCQICLIISEVNCNCLFHNKVIFNNHNDEYYNYLDLQNHNSYLDKFKDILLIDNNHNNYGYDDILKIIFDHRIKKENFGKNRIIICSDSPLDDKEMDNIIFSFPNIIYWNLNSDNFKFDNTSSPGITKIEGFSTELIKDILIGKIQEFTSIDIMRYKLDNPNFIEIEEIVHRFFV